MHNLLDRDDDDCEETWEDTDENINEDLDNHPEDFSIPTLPTFDSTNPNSITGRALSLWIIGFLLRLHSRYFIPDVALDTLIKFLYIFFSILARFSPFLEVIRNNFPRSLYDMKNFFHCDKSFTRFVLCPKCAHIYNFKEAINEVGSKQSSKNCSHVRYPNHPFRSQRTPCQTLLLKTVTTITGRKFLYPFALYCYKPLISSLQRLLLLPNFFSECQTWRDKGNDNLSDIYDGRI